MYCYLCERRPDITAQLYAPPLWNDATNEGTHQGTGSSDMGVAGGVVTGFLTA